MLINTLKSLSTCELQLTLMRTKKKITHKSYPHTITIVSDEIDDHKKCKYLNVNYTIGLGKL